MKVKKHSVFLTWVINLYSKPIWHLFCSQARGCGSNPHGDPKKNTLDYISYFYLNY